ncbi:unnamed protein product [Moneuplotes crassus]|uniref:Uncharacterized protein n=1 Tax=Euplotes crassus TaxID=5936 RepID=A0AAD1Y7E3_EUPCR|nr:unnamed protein product [Moneuplotes crassus]
MSLWLVNILANFCILKTVQMLFMTVITYQNYLKLDIATNKLDGIVSGADFMLKLLISLNLITTFISQFTWDLMIIYFGDLPNSSESLSLRIRKCLSCLLQPILSGRCQSLNEELQCLYMIESTKEYLCISTYFCSSCSLNTECILKFFGLIREDVKSLKMIDCLLCMT